MQIYPQNVLLSKWFLTIGNRFLNFVEKKMLFSVSFLKNRTFENVKMFCKFAHVDISKKSLAWSAS